MHTVDIYIKNYKGFFLQHVLMIYHIRILNDLQVDKAVINRVRFKVKQLKKIVMKYSLPLITYKLEISSECRVIAIRAI